MEKKLYESAVCLNPSLKTIGKRAIGKTIPRKMVITNKNIKISGNPKLTIRLSEIEKISFWPIFQVAFRIFLKDGRKYLISWEYPKDERVPRIVSNETREVYNALKLVLRFLKNGEVDMPSLRENLRSKGIILKV